MPKKFMSPIRLTAVVGVVALVVGLASSVPASAAPAVVKPAAGKPVSNTKHRVTPAAPTIAGTGAYNASTMYNGQPQDFYTDASGNLRHAWYAGGVWNTESLDGPGSSYPGHPAGGVGPFIAVIVYAGQLHVWYESAAGGLRHAWYRAASWSFETLDGVGSAGGNGRTGNQIAGTVSVVLYQGQPHVWYPDTTAGTLRHAWLTSTGWSFEALDGMGGPNGRVHEAVGTDSSVLLYQGQPHAWYYDSFAGTLRHAWFTSTGWAFESLDGLGVAAGGGRVSLDDVGTFTSVSLYLGLPHVWYYDNDAGTLRHAWWTGRGWAFETLDGLGGANGRVAAGVGTFTSVSLYSGQPHVWYFDVAGTLRHAWWSGTAWNFESLDGVGTPPGNGRNDDITGLFTSVSLYLGQPHVWYFDETAGTLRHSWWNGSAWNA
jgi:hypothetical protein